VERSMSASCAPDSPRTNESIHGQTQTTLIPWRCAGPAPVARTAGDRPDRFDDGGRPVARVHPARRFAPRQPDRRIAAGLPAGPRPPAVAAMLDELRAATASGATG